MGNPMYRQIAEDLRAQIEGGDLEPGQQLPTEIELRDHYGASRNTIRDAIKLLAIWGMVETRSSVRQSPARERLSYGRSSRTSPP
jgi:GntR family transcriptional regulator